MSAETQIVDEFLESLQGHGSLPYLFVGSGISRRYLQTPDWRGLLETFASKANINFSRLASECNQDLEQMATRIAKSFQDTWWESDDFRAQREAFPEPINADHILKIAVSWHLQQLQQAAEIPEQQKSELKKLESVVVDGIVTTNYDTLLEQVFPDFDSYIGQEELLFGDAQFVGEIYKIHGSVTAPGSMVLTADDFEEIETKNQYLAAKLLTIFAEHPVIFVGYSLSDKYIAQILSDIAKAVGSNRLGELGSRIYFVYWNSDPDSTPTMSSAQIDRGGHLLPITEIETHSFEWIWDAMGKLERTFPAKVLRALKKRVYELVTNPDPEDEIERVQAIPIESEEAESQRVVFGVTDMTDQQLSALKGFGTQTLKRSDLDKDLVGLSDSILPAEIVLRTGIVDQIRAQSSWYLPVWKYINDDGRISKDGEVDLKDLDPLIRELAQKDSPSFQSGAPERYKETFGETVTAKEILDSNEPLYFKMSCVRLFLQETNDAEKVRDALKEWFSDGNLKYLSDTNVRKALFELDRALYRPVQLKENA